MNISFARTHLRRIPWPIVTRVLTGIMVLAVIVLLFNLARRLDWAAVLESAATIGTPTLALAMSMVVLAHLVYTTFDLLAKRYAGTPLPWWKVMGVSSLSYAMNLNLGVLVGGVAIRFRLYHRLGVRAAIAGKVVAFSTLTNWIGYGWLAGVLFIIGAIPLPGAWDLGRAALQLVGLAMLAGIGLYLGLCAFSRRRSWRIRRHRIELPPIRLAVAQCILAGISWSLMGGIIYILLGQQVQYTAVLGILLFCSIAAVIAHIPGGLGVTEAIFVGALAGSMPAHEVLAGVLTYRVLYCVVPLALALPAYLITEARLRGRTPKATEPEARAATTPEPQAAARP
ncbi:lysylphosphatidylglycerol synthase domain-containing protein [Pusillimonas sp.]|uniref:lysylphosphatidylglycerol synthase domain-containing protein n=1 Tax=Pusillimonas sp. TaxID=3040095 RepID=UPI0037C9335B